MNKSAYKSFVFRIKALKIHLFLTVRSYQSAKETNINFIKIREFHNRILREIKVFFFFLVLSQRLRNT